MPAIIPYTVTIPGVGEGRMLLELYAEGGGVVCGIYKLVGWINLPPKQWLRVVRKVMADIEREAKASGVAEMRVAGRSWARILPDYEPFADVRNGLKKRL